MKVISCQAHKTVSEWNMPCLVYALGFAEVTCCCCHVSGLQSVDHMLSGIQRTVLAFISLFVMWRSLKQHPPRALLQGSALFYIFLEKNKTKTKTRKETDEESEREDRQTKRRQNHFRKEWHGTETTALLKPVENTPPPPPLPLINSATSEMAQSLCLAESSL